MKLNPTLKSLWWLIFVCTIGFVQIGIVFLGTRFNANQVMTLDKFYAEGFFLFFSISLIAGIIHEYAWEAECKGIPKWVNQGFLTFSILLGLAAMVTYALGFSSKFTASTLHNYTVLQQYLTGFTVCISLAMKGLIYHTN